MSDSRSIDPERDRDANARHFNTEHMLGDLAKRSLRGSGIALTAQAAKLLLQTASVIVLARLLTPEDFGLLAMVTAITGFLAMFKDAGLSLVTIQRPEINHAEVSVLFWINTALGAAVTLVVVALAPVIGWLFHEPKLVWITVALAGIFVFGGLTVQHRALLCRQMRFGMLATIEIVSLASGIASGLLMAWGGLKYWALVGGTAGGAIVQCVLAWVCCKWRPGLIFKAPGIRSLLKFGGGLTGFDMLNYFTRNFDNIIVGYFLGSAALGIYSRAYALLLLPIQQINSPLGGVMIPALSRLQAVPEEYADFYLRSLQALSLITVPLVVFTFVLARDVILLLMGPQWLATVPVFQLLAPAAVVGAINIAPGWLCISRGRARIQLHYGLVSAPVCVTSFLIGIRWGVEGVAAGFSVTFVVLFWAFVWYACKNSPVKFLEVLSAFLLPFFISCIAGWIVWSLRQGQLLHAGPAFALIACGAPFGLTYILGAMLFKKTRNLVMIPFQAIQNLLHSAKNV